MEIEERKEGNVLIIKIGEKRLAADVAFQFKQKMAAFIEEGHSTIIVDISDLEFIDSSGLASLVFTLKLLKEKDNFLICGAQGPVKSIFEITRMDKVFQMFGDDKAALAALSA